MTKKAIELKKFLRFNKKDDVDEWTVINKQDEVLGQIYYFKDWGGWVFEPVPESFFDSKCLNQIVTFMQSLRS